MIVLEQVGFKYEEKGPWVLKGLSLEVGLGEWVFLVGANGSGKSTLAELMAGLLLPKEGRILVMGKDTRSMPPCVSGKVGFVFQNPENQFFHTTVAEDISFGPENLGLSPQEVHRRTERVLQELGLRDLAHVSPQKLSGGQKQLAAIGGILAMEPSCLILDEPTSMLDPSSRRLLKGLVRTIHKQRGCAIIWITQDLQEVVGAQRVLVLHRGTIGYDGPWRPLFEGASILEDAGLERPLSVELERSLREMGMNEAADRIHRRALEILWGSVGF